jgi:hypothetical protein
MGENSQEYRERNLNRSFDAKDNGIPNSELCLKERAK